MVFKLLTGTLAKTAHLKEEILEWSRRALESKPWLHPSKLDVSNLGPGNKRTNLPCAPVSWTGYEIAPLQAIRAVSMSKNLHCLRLAHVPLAPVPWTGLCGPNCLSDAANALAIAVRTDLFTVCSTSAPVIITDR